MLGALAGAAEPSMADLQEGQALAWQVVGQCRAAPGDCRDGDGERQLARAFYTLVIDDLVQGRPVDSVAVANVRYLSEDLWQRLPDTARTPAPTPAEWVVALRTPPAPTPRPAATPAPVAEPPPETAVQAVNVDALPPSAQIAALWTMRSQPGIGPKLVQALEQAQLPAAALALTLDSADPSWTLAERAEKAIALSGALGTHRLLLDWEGIHQTEDWSEAERPIGLLLSGIANQEKGQYSPALKAYAALEPSEPGWLQSQYQRGLIKWQTGDPWGALRHFRNAAEGELHLPDDAVTKEEAVWRAAALYDELGRPSDAISTWEVLTIQSGPLAQRAALACAWAAHEAGDSETVEAWLPSWPARGIYRPQHDLLLAHRALAQKDKAAARALIDRARDDIAARDRTLADLLDDLGDLWTRLDQTNDAVLTDRLAATAQVAGWRSALTALEAERQYARDLPPSEARDAVRTRLDRMRATTRGHATTSAYYAVSGVRRELEALDRNAARVQRRLTVH